VADAAHYGMACQSVIDNKKNRSNPDPLQAFGDPVQNGLTKQIEHGCGGAEKSGHRPREIFHCRRLRAYVFTDTVA
jgi:hypothetical protein